MANLATRTKSYPTGQANQIVIGSRNNNDTMKTMAGTQPLNPNGGLQIANRLYFTCDNSSVTNATKDFHIFDAIGAVASLESWSANAPTVTPLTHAILIQYLQTRPLVISGIRLQATSSSAQFNNPLVHYIAQLDGTLFKKNYNLDDAVLGDKYDEKIQAYSFPNGLLIDLMTAFKLTVNASEKVYVTMYIMKDLLKINSFGV